MVMATTHTRIEKMSFQLEQLERRVALLEKRASMSRVASIQKIAGKAYLFDEGLTKAKVGSGEGAMLYKIDKGKNQSKYYEMLITPVRDSYGLPKFQLKKQWGRLGPRNQNKVVTFDTLRSAKQALAIVLANKVRGGYVSTYDASVHKTIGGQLKSGQYPIGLNAKAGPWRNQEVSSEIKTLRKLRNSISETLDVLEDGVMPSKVLKDLEKVHSATESFDESLTREIRKRLRPPMERLRGTNKRFVRCPKKTVRELRSLHNYLKTQLSVIS